MQAPAGGVRSVWLTPSTDVQRPRAVPFIHGADTRTHPGSRSTDPDDVPLGSRSAFRGLFRQPLITGGRAAWPPSGAGLERNRTQGPSGYLQASCLIRPSTEPVMSHKKPPRAPHLTSFTSGMPTIPQRPRGASAPHHQPPNLPTGSDAERTTSIRWGAKESSSAGYPSRATGCGWAVSSHMTMDIPSWSQIAPLYAQRVAVDCIPRVLLSWLFPARLTACLAKQTPSLSASPAHALVAHAADKTLPDTTFQISA